MALTVNVALSVRSSPTPGPLRIQNKPPAKLQVSNGNAMGPGCKIDTSEISPVNVPNELNPCSRSNLSRRIYLA